MPRGPRGRAAMTDRPLFEDEQLTLVDDHDRPVGRASKRDCHLGDGRTHRAFSTVLVDPAGRLLLARRASAKPLWPGFWDATVASHPRPDEGYAEAADRRVREELGAATQSELGQRFRYRIAYREVGYEDELCAALIGTVDPDRPLAPVPGEIDALRWVEADALARELEGRSSSIAPWMPLTLLGLPDPLPFDRETLDAACRRWLEGETFATPYRFL